MGGRRGACGARPRRRWTVVAPHRRCGGHRRELPRYRWAAAGPSQASRSTTLNRMLTRHTRCRWAAAGPGRASRSTTPSEARVWRSRGRDAAHRHQHAATNTQPQAHRHNEAARPHRGPGGSRVRPLGSHQRKVQRIWVPSEPRRMITQRFCPARRAGAAIR